MDRRRFLTLGGLALASAPLSSLVRAQTYGSPMEPAAPLCAATLGDAQGPFYLSGAPHQAVLGPESERSVRRIHLRGQLVGMDCSSPYSGCAVDIWHADTEGAYHMEGDAAYLYRGVVRTDAEGRFEIDTIRPGNYSIGGDYMRPAHYHIKVHSTDGADLLTTQFYFDDDAYLGAADGCQPRTCNSYDESRYLHLTTGEAAMEVADLRIVI